MSLSLEEKIDMLECYIQQNKSATCAKRAYCTEKGIRNGPSAVSFTNVYETYRETGSVEEHPRKRARTVRTDEKIEEVKTTHHESLAAGSSLSVRRGGQQAQITKTSYHRTLREDLKMYPYIPRLIHKLNEDDPDRRVEWCEAFEELCEEDPETEALVVWTDEAIFTLDGHVNRHNCVFWSEENPHVELNVGLNLNKVMVWMGVWSGGRVGPFFFDATVTGENYLALLRDNVFPILEEEMDIDRLIFQQDGCPAHYSTPVRDFLDGKCRWMGRRGTIEWPARSPDLTVPDFFVWGYLKNKVFARSPQTMEELRTFITEEFNAIPQEMIEKACKSVVDRAVFCRLHHGRPFKNLEMERKAFNRERRENLGVEGDPME